MTARRRSPLVKACHRLGDLVTRLGYAIRLAIEDVALGRGTRLHPGVVLDTRQGGAIRLGAGCSLHRGVLIATYGGDVTIGDRCSINAYSAIYGSGGVRIGDGVRIAAHSVIVASSHVFASRERPIVEQGFTAEGVVIEDDVWLGAGVKVLDGVTIAKGCVIAAGAVVTRSTEPYGIYGGVPARLLKPRP